MIELSPYLVSKLREELLNTARKTLEQNKECFVAQWILQNPDKRIEDYTLVERVDWVNGVHEFWIEGKE